jgi:ribulose 1,5-bisphosphate carboxylase large subunit-like protein
MSWIAARIKIVPIKDGKSVSPDDAQGFIDQVKEDALFGTYAELDHAYWNSRMDRPSSALTEVELIGNPETTPDGLTAYMFELRLASALFPPAMGGLQHLFGVLAGDLMRFTLPPISLKSAVVEELKFPDDWDETHFQTFRRHIANDIQSIRSAFNLSPGKPLLAYSFKPRVGFKLESLRQIAFDVLDAGFNIVELDTRFLPLSHAMLDNLIDLASDVASRHRNHVGRLSLNLSLPTDIAVDAARKLCTNCPQPVVLKIDGGFNGLSAIQAVRRLKVTDGRKLGPITTCYPLLQSTLSQFIPGDNYFHALAKSGVDIIYPGRRPDLGNMSRSIEGSGENALRSAVERYQRLLKPGWPMLSIAGGIYPGQLQAFYELLGPDVAWYLGGAVALHKGGPAAGAKLCVKIAEQSALLRYRAGENWADDLPQSLSDECDAMFKGRSALPNEALRYVSPKNHLAGRNGLKPYQQSGS